MKKSAAKKNPMLSSNGQVVRVGQIICADGPTYGRVAAAMGGCVIFRGFSENGTPHDGQCFVATCADVSVVEDGAEARLPGNADRWVGLAVALAEIIDDLEFSHNDGTLDEAMCNDTDAKKTIQSLKLAFEKLWGVAARNEVLLFNEPKARRGAAARLPTPAKGG